MIKIPILNEGEQPTKVYIETLRQAIDSDGCSKSPDIYGDCCVIHDLMYRFGIDIYGKPCKKKDADAFLRQCMEKSSFLRKFSLIAKLYWLGVKNLGAWAYADDIDNRPEFETYPYTL